VRSEAKTPVTLVPSITYVVERSLQHGRLRDGVGAGVVLKQVSKPAVWESYRVTKLQLYTTLGGQQEQQPNSCGLAAIISSTAAAAVAVSWSYGPNPLKLVCGICGVIQHRLMTADQLQIFGDHHIALNEVCTLLYCQQICFLCVLWQPARGSAMIIAHEQPPKAFLLLRSELSSRL
jgi:hypothetical protein